LPLLALVALAGGGVAIVAESRDDARPGGGAAADAVAAGRLPPAPPSSPASVALEGRDAFRARFRRPPRGALVFDVGTGEVLWRRDPLRTRPVASLTKVMTALLVATSTRPRERVRIPAAALRYEGRGVGVLKRGRRVTVDALLAAALITSANDASIALAHHVGGSVRGFARLMNERARLLGLRCTRFVSPHGLGRRNRSCPADLAALTRLAMAERRIAEPARLAYTQIRAPVRGKRLYLATTNPLLATGYRGTVGLKTGYTQAAGRCLIAVVRRGARTLGVVLLGSPNPGEQAKRLVEAALRRG
jgi:serine-type D-Ala-D-Ala carboxypeptidase (penicillin-binding protein 5/6)